MATLPSELAAEQARAAAAAARTAADIAKGHADQAQSLADSLGQGISAATGGAIDPVATFRASGYRKRAAHARPAVSRVGAGIV